MSVQINFCITCNLPNVEKMTIVGGIDGLGQWKPENGLLLSLENQKWISQQPLIANQNSSFEFKICLWQKDSNQVQWEPLPNNVNHKLQTVGEVMILEWEYGKIDIENTANKYAVVAEKEFEISILKEELAKLTKDSQAQCAILEKERNELNADLQAEKKKFADASSQLAQLQQETKKNSNQKQQKQISELQNQLAQAKTNLDQEKQINENQNKLNESEIANLKQIIEDREKQYDQDKQILTNLTIENADLKIQIGKLNKEIVELKAASSTQAPVAKENVKDAQSPAQEGESKEAENAQGGNKKKNNKNKNK